MRKIIYTTQINNKEYSLYLSDEEGFLRTCLEKRIPAAALIPNTKYIENSLKTSNADLGFFPGPRKTRHHCRASIPQYIVTFYHFPKPL